MTAAVLILGIAVARLAKSMRQSAVTVVAGVTIFGALVGGFLIALRLNRLAENVEVRDHSEDPA
jgi:uncharacterized membrane protein YqgA involved in biofilm formation